MPNGDRGRPWLIDGWSGKRAVERPKPRVVAVDQWDTIAWLWEWSVTTSPR